METPFKYDWDNISTGRPSVNDSQKFFRFKHENHEKKDGKCKKLLYGEIVEKNKENDINELNTEQQQDTTCTFGTDDDEKFEPCKAVNKSIKKIANITKDDAQKKIIPKVYEYNEVYKKRRQEQIQLREKEERKTRVFHSKPAPKFKNNFNNRKEFINKITIPETPLVLTRSKKAEEKRKQNISEQEIKIPIFTSRPANVLHKEPYKPKKQNHSIDLKPFQLKMEKRLEERKAFDEKQKKLFEQKQKQKKEEEVKLEKELIQKARKLAIFKARPNPFK